MFKGNLSSVKRGFIALALGFFSVSALAVSLDLQVQIGGEWVGTYNEGQLGCVDDQNADGTSAPTANCVGSGFNVPGTDVTLDAWDLFLDEDPIVSGITAITNNGATDQQITLMFTLPITPAIPGGTVIGGSIQGGLTDTNGGGATLSAPTGSSFYTALIDGVAVQTLYDDPTSFAVPGTNPFGSENVPALQFGTPIPSLAGPPALTSIGIKLDFILSAGDSASFTSVFVVEPSVVPVPAAVWLFGSALGLLGWVRRRQTV